MPRRIVVPGSLLGLAGTQEGLVSSRQCHAHGLTDQQTAALVRSGRWERVRFGVLDTGHRGPSVLDPFDRARRREAVLGVLALPGSIAAGVAALVLQEVQGAPQVVIPEVVLPDGSPRSTARGVRVRRTPARSWMLVRGLPCLRVETALAQAVPDLGRYHAVALMDSARHLRKISEAGFRRARSASRGRRGAARSNAWWEESDRRAESPAETWARLSCVDAGCPPDALQLVVRDRRDRFVARVDLAWVLPDGGVLLVEIDGREVHSRLEALLDDRHRQNALTGRRTVMLRFSGADAWRGRVAAQVRSLLDAQGWVPHPTDEPYRLTS
ncbi:hypothetical protein LEP48_14015 [Isoptericola sp. NEAU-Y5]|uniref:DUF559 domain-containing protein n=1 Tax=Isoptericola luteus TaxID=2879484 RepID=A0ABS7ZKT0_9MICO|nr:hypothetical protein [Isoptericola sp. NEAU-Y5]MCA5894454.1 hypothetical protein [Isoptericola sp. NEAU-Y5]